MAGYFKRQVPQPPAKTPLEKLDHIVSVPKCIVAQEGKKLKFTMDSPMPRTDLAQRKHSVNGGSG